jgi:hypothetical protein
VHNTGNTTVGAVPMWLAEVWRLNGQARGEIERLFLTACATLDVLDDPDVGLFAIRRFAQSGYSPPSSRLGS